MIIVRLVMVKELFNLIKVRKLIIVYVDKICMSINNHVGMFKLFLNSFKLVL